MSACHSLKPLSRRGKRNLHGTFDIETTPLPHAKFIAAGAYDGENYYFFPKVRDLVDFLVSANCRNRVWYAHNGGRFDFLFLHEELIKQNIKYSMINQGARIVEMKFKFGKNRTRLRDSYCLLREKLSKLSDVFCPETPKQTGAINFEAGECFDPKNPVHLEYLRADCVSLYDILEKFQGMPFIKESGIRLTIASTSLAAWRTTLKAPIKMTPFWVQDFCREAYAGGRTEIFKTHMGKGACFDVNSMYPAMMLKPMPLELLCEARDYTQFGFHEVDVFVPRDTYIPVLWRKSPKLVFPTGHIRGVFFSEEIKLAVEHGARVTKYHRGYEFTQSDDLFREYVLKNFDLRLKYPGTALAMVGKDLPNNLYGKTGEKEEKKSFQRVDPNDPGTWPDCFQVWRSKEDFQKWGFIEVIRPKNSHDRRKPFQRSPHMLVHLAAAVTAYGRMHMFENYYHPYRESLAYTDTDSAMLTREIPSAPGLGKCKREYGIESAFFLLPKIYYIEHSPGYFDAEGNPILVTRKVKGFPRKYLERLTRGDFEAGRLSYQKLELLTFRESLVRTNDFLGVGEKMKKIQAVYDKRDTMPDGTTIPWFVNAEGELEDAKYRRNDRRRGTPGGRGIRNQRAHVPAEGASYERPSA